MLLPSLSGLLLVGQSSPLLLVTPPEPVKVKAGATFSSSLAASLNEGFHMNSNTPTEKYLIPVSLKWTAGVVEAETVQYPKPQSIKLDFEAKPLSILSGKFTFVTKFKAAPNAPVGPTIVTGKLRYQACNDKACFPPKTVEIKLPVDIL
jgi:hypothetical protein